VKPIVRYIALERPGLDPTYWRQFVITSTDAEPYWGTPQPITQATYRRAVERGEWTTVRRLWDRRLASLFRSEVRSL